jgi:hypothetical protein
LPDRSLEFRRDKLHGLPSVAGDLFEEALTGRSITEAYLALDLALHFHVRVGSSDGDWDTEDFCIHLQRKAKDNVSLKGSSPNVAVPTARRNLEVHFHRGEKRWLDQAMFVVVGNVAHEREGVRVGGRRFRPIPTSIGLHSLNQCPMTLRESGKQKLLDVGGTKVVQRRRTRERRLVHFSAPRVHEREFEDKLIERTPEIVNGIPDENAKGLRKGIDLCNGQNPKLAVEVSFLVNGYRWRLLPVVDAVQFVVKRAHVLIAPVQLGSDSFERMRHQVTSS